LNVVAVSETAGTLNDALQQTPTLFFSCTVTLFAYASGRVAIPRCGPFALTVIRADP
jgi:hypothetical protein